MPLMFSVSSECVWQHTGRLAWTFESPTMRAGSVGNSLEEWEAVARQDGLHRVWEGEASSE